MIKAIKLFFANITGGGADPIKSISAQRLADHMKKNKRISIIDVRTPKEVSQGKIKGAKNINVTSGDFINKIDKLDKSKTHFVYCRSGVRSMKACKMMKRQGLENIINLNGGITGWMNARNKVV